MKQNTNALWIGLAVPALIAFSSRGEELAFGPSDGDAIHIVFSSDSEMSLEDSAYMMNGQSLDFEMEMSNSVQHDFAFTDRFVSMDGGRVTKLERTYDELAATTHRTMSAPMMGGEMDSTAEGSSELEGQTVTFTWDEDSGEYQAEFAEGSGGDEELLEGLAVDLDFAGLLPDEEVSVGDTWSIDPEVLRACFAPGGALKIEMESDDDSPMGMGGPEPSPDQVLGELTGDTTGELIDVVEEDGLRLAVVKLQVDVATARDLTELMEEMMDPDMIPEGAEMSFEAFDMEFRFEGEGELRWNLEAGVMHSFELSGEQTTATDSSVSMNMQGQEMEIENSMTMSGATSYRFEVTVEG